MSIAQARAEERDFAIDCFLKLVCAPDWLPQEYHERAELWCIDELNYVKGAIRAGGK